MVATVKPAKSSIAADLDTLMTSIEDEMKDEGPESSKGKSVLISFWRHQWKR